MNLRLLNSAPGQHCLADPRTNFANRASPISAVSPAKYPRCGFSINSCCISLLPHRIEDVDGAKRALGIEADGRKKSESPSSNVFNGIGKVILRHLLS